RSQPDIDGDVEGGAGQGRDKLCLGEGRRLEMEAAERSLLCRERLVHLDEIDLPSRRLSKALLVVDLGEVAPIVAEASRRDLQAVGDPELLGVEKVAPRSHLPMREAGSFTAMVAGCRRVPPSPAKMTPCIPLAPDYRRWLASLRTLRRPAT